MIGLINKARGLIAFYAILFCAMVLDIRKGAEILLSDEPEQHFTDSGKVKNSNHLGVDLLENIVRDGSDMEPPSYQQTVSPTLGKHRPGKDVVFGNTNSTFITPYVVFISTLRETGFSGDVVLSVPPLASLTDEIRQLLKYHSKYGLVVYAGVVTPTDSQSLNVTLSKFYQGKLGMVVDPRPPRPEVLARYELFWSWSKYYRASSRVLITDVDNTFFQRHPFAPLEEGDSEVQDDVENYADNDADAGGDLHLYEDNKLIKTISYTAIEHAYGNVAINIIKSQPNLLPMIVHGHQTAMEVYLRAMVRQYDVTKCEIEFCDFAMVNFLHYFSVLHSQPGIKSVTVHPTDTRVVNCKSNSKPQTSSIVYNYQNSEYLLEGTMQWAYGLYEDMNKELPPFQKGGNIVWNRQPPPTAYKSDDTTATLVKPNLGEHREDVDAVFVCTVGHGLTLLKLALFVCSLRETGFDGDIVISVSKRSNVEDEVWEFLEYHSHRGLVVYAGKIVPVSLKIQDNVKLNQLYSIDKDSNRYLKDRRPARVHSMLRYELFWAWSTAYRTSSRILIAEMDQTFFQAHPFENERELGSDAVMGDLHFIGEHANSAHWNNLKPDGQGYNKFVAMLPAEARNLILEKSRPLFTPNKIPCNPGVMLGHKVALEAYLRAIVNKADSFSCYSSSCDWAIHNYLLYNELLPRGSSFIRVIPHVMGLGPVNTMGLDSFRIMESRKLFSDGVVKNWDGTTSKIVVHIFLYKELANIFLMRTKEYIAEYIKKKEPAAETLEERMK